ncbi:ferredoxin--NADP reductase [Nocardioides sp. R-C-SC26]|uniref:ferredoxin--NADP reductase n=1 Tax=Nocardioides sp. R-C-SC26 TaxID=2870414 RepID=UPI001E619252|nr:ferredoxin--NADP reductase [Nocardioides sp. R-C-SC26]
MSDSHVLEVVDVVQETPDAHSITFAVPAELAEQFRYKPGQFLTLAVPSDQTVVAARCYSFSSSPVGDAETVTITVKRTAEGYASNWICDNLVPGSSIRVLPPSGIFTPASLDADLLLFAGGSGVTPIMSITRTALAQGSGRITVFYANRDEQSVIFARELTELAAAHPERLHVVHWLESVQGLPTQEQLRSFAADHPGRDCFTCGPAPFMKLVMSALKELEIPRELRHQEKFVSLGGNPFGDVVGPHTEDVAAEEIADAEADAGSADGSDDAAVEPTGPAATGSVRLEVELDGETHVFDDWGDGTSMLEHLEKKGVKAPYSCREGECSACAVRLLEGEVEMAHNDVLDDDDLGDGIRLACQATPTTDVVRATYS